MVCDNNKGTCMYLGATYLNELRVFFSWSSVMD